MKKLSVDYSKCQECWNCNSILPGFRSIHGGILLISKTNVSDEEIRAAVNRVKSACPNDAIIYQDYP